MNRSCLASALVVASFLASAAPRAETPVFCNPLNLNYQVQHPNGGGDRKLWIREGADPTVGLFKGKYYLFSSVSDGYWESENLADWKSLIPASYLNLPILHCYAPTVVVIGDTMYLKDGNGPGPVFGTKTPENPDSWKQISERGWHRPDAQFFLDDDGRLWIAYGCSGTGNLNIMEIDTKTFMPTGESHEYYMPDIKNRGWEGSTSGKRGIDHSEYHGWIEGGQLLKQNGTYYFVYTLPQLNNSYANGVYTAKNILGPYTYQKHNPIAQKLTGFVTGSAHGEYIKDRYGNWWNFVLHAVWTYDRFERRIGMYPASIDEHGVLLCNTWIGDYPMLVPQQKRDSSKSLWNGMNLLSVHRPVTVSSANSDDQGNVKENVVDEDVTTYWSAKTGAPDEWVEVDLGSPCLVEAVQANFCEVDFQLKQERPSTYQIYGQLFAQGKTPTPEDFKKLIPEAQQQIPRDPEAVIRYKVLGSRDGKNWELIIDQSASTLDTPHDFNLAPKPVKSRYVRLVNVHMPYNGKFALRELRVFGKGFGSKPAVPEFQVERKKIRKRMEISWAPVKDADGYVVRYGQEKDRLYLANQFYNTTSVVINSLENEKEYFVTVDAFNQNGYTEGRVILPVLVDANPTVWNLSRRNRFDATDCSLFSGAAADGSFVGSLHVPGAGCAVTVDAGAGGAFELTIGYAGMNAAKAALIVNGAPEQVLDFPATGSWTEVIKEIRQPVSLKPGGENKIELLGRGHGVNLAYFMLKAVKTKDK